jgi:hypothetical protein
MSSVAAITAKARVGKSTKVVVPPIGHGQSSEAAEEALDRQAVAAATRGDFAKASTLFWRHVGSASADAKAWEMLSQVELELGSCSKAARCASEACKLCPEWAVPHLTMARALAGMGELVVASHALDAADTLARAAGDSALLVEVAQDRDGVRAALSGWMDRVRSVLTERHDKTSSASAEVASSSSSAAALPEADKCPTCAEGRPALPALPETPAARAAAEGIAPGLGLSWDLPLSWKEVDSDPELRFWRAVVVEEEEGSDAPDAPPRQTDDEAIDDTMV